MRSTARSVSRLLALSIGALGCAGSRAPSHYVYNVRAEPTSCASARSADSTIYDSTGVTEGPVPRSAPKLQYPVEARRQRIQGRAVVTMVVSAGGEVEPSSVTVTQSAHPLLDAEARRIVSHATFWPACRNGVAVRARMAIPFAFKLSRDLVPVGFAILAGVWAGMMGAMMH